MVDLDLAKFFDRVHHQRLLARIADRVKDPRIIALVRLMLKAAVMMPDGTKIAVKEGTPQGGPLSPMLSNIVLNELDGELARRGPVRRRKSNRALGDSRRLPVKFDHARDEEAHLALAREHRLNGR